LTLYSVFSYSHLWLLSASTKLFVTVNIITLNIHVSRDAKSLEGRIMNCGGQGSVKEVDPWNYYSRLS
jgi:hypothetical protein